MSAKPLEAAENLDEVSRLALIYAPVSARNAWAALLVLDRRLAEAAPSGREPLMIQIRLAWWRDRLQEDSEAWPSSEPVLQALKAWNGQHKVLVRLVDGWESAVIGEDGGVDLRAARIEAYIALAQLLGVERLDAVREAALETVDPSTPSRARHRLPRSMRPLAVLRVVAQRNASPDRNNRPLLDMMRVVRAGTLGW
jgi:phytoene synthase